MTSYKKLTFLELITNKERIKTLITAYCFIFIFLAMKTEISLIQNGSTFTSKHINQTKNIKG